MTPLSWSDWPARRQPARAAFAAGVLALCVALTATQDLILALLALLLLSAATGDALLPTRYALDEEGVLLTGPLKRRRIPWRHFQSFRTSEEGFFLAGAGPYRLLRRRRDLWLRCPGAEQAVAERLRQSLPEAR